MFFPELSNYYPEVFVASAFTFENFLWARGLFDSRAINMKIGGEVKTCLVPFVDMINHCLRAGVPAGAFDDETQTFKLTANSPYTQGSQVFLHYGPLKNWQLLLYYGFLIPNNPYDSMSVYFELPEDELAEEKEALLEKHSLSREHSVRASSISPRALSALRICVADSAELELLRDGKVDPIKGQISSRNESETLNAFLATLRALLAERALLGSGEDADEEEQEEEEEEEEATANTKAARAFKGEEVKLLEAAVELVEVKLRELGDV